MFLKTIVLQKPKQACTPSPFGSFYQFPCLAERVLLWRERGGEGLFKTYRGHCGIVVVLLNCHLDLMIIMHSKNVPLVEYRRYLK